MESYQSYKKINNIAGWLVLLFATVVYAMTLESSGSFWDCGEFVPCCWRLQVPHSPGAPLFVMIGRFFTFFAFGDTSRVAIMVNFMSGLSTAFAMMFIYWTTTHLAGKVFFKNKETDYTKANITMVVGAGVIAAACATFLDSMWFSAVEGEVYALSQFFMGFIVWAIMKWDSIDDKEDKYADRWLILICYMVGLSIGVHLLSLLALPFIALVYYYKRFSKATVIGFLLANAIGFVILGFAMKFVISYTQSFLGSFDKFFVNSLGMPFWSGAVTFIFILVALLAFGIYYSQYLRGKGKWDTVALAVAIVMVIGLSLGITSSVLFFLLIVSIAIGLVIWAYYSQSPNKHQYWNLGLLCVAFVYIGYMSYALIPIRAGVNPPIDMGRPRDPFSIKAYVDRDQYGDRPLTWGPDYTASQADIERTKETGDKWYMGKTKYEEGGKKFEYVFRDDVCMLFPRLGFWGDEGKKAAYRYWIQPSTQLIDRKTGQAVQDFDAGQTDYAEQVLEQHNAQDPGRYTLKDKIGQWENFKFFVKYQLGYMYLRYFMWNFAGKSDDQQGRFDNDNGRWICGIPFIDNMSNFFTPEFPQDHLSPNMAANKGRNKFYMIPFLLGLIGFVYTLYKHDKIFLVVLVLFGVTGVLQLIYQNEPPFEPRERDYALAGSFWAFCIWIGFGIMAIAQFVRSRIKNNDLPIVAGVLAVCVSAPYLMGSQGWDDHSRHGRYTTRDLARDYLESCAPNALLFTQGDNDTYPLWYAQGVENIRPDVRIINLSLIGVDWYIEQLKFRWNDAPPVKITFKDEQIDGDKRDVTRYSAAQNIPAGTSIDLKKVMEFIASEDPDKKTASGPHGEMESYLPARNIFVEVDTNKVKALNMVDPRDMGKVVPRMQWAIAGTLLKNDLITLDMIANNIMDRPIYYAVSVSPDAYEGLNKYFQLEGMTYRVVPIENPAPNHKAENCPVRTDICYTNMVEKFRFGGIKENQDLYLDENIIRMTMNLRGNYARLAEALIGKGEKDKAIKALDKAMLEMPKKAVPYDIFVAMYPNIYYAAGAPDKAKKLSDELWAAAKEEIKYYQYAYGVVVQRAKDSGNKLESDALAQGKFLQTSRDLNQDLYMLRELAQAARTYEKPEVASAMDKEFTDLQYSFAPYQRQQMQQQQQQKQQKGAGPALQ